MIVGRIKDEERPEDEPDASECPEHVEDGLPSDVVGKPPADGHRDHGAELRPREDERDPAAALRRRNPLGDQGVQGGVRDAL